MSWLHSIACIDCRKKSGSSRERRYCVVHSRELPRFVNVLRRLLDMAPITGAGLRP
jgi:hypothetical protein